MVRGKLGHGMEDYVVAENRKINGHENGEATQISVDHDPQKEKEHVESKGKVPRVDEQLEMARAFGDGRLKEHITSEPDIMIEHIDEDTGFITLGSDGLLKVKKRLDFA
ncbi:protein phosphatase 2C 58 [Populus alba x Populus x berolinensis]|nr:protein phosphatase 2C 58 [Populus alba x Populus x berolinensis]KAJ7015364.1 protein phosphatase 2C 58 [Populus alba x Populus x berolinensis]